MSQREYEAIRALRRGELDEGTFLRAIGVDAPDIGDHVAALLAMAHEEADAGAVDGAMTLAHFFEAESARFLDAWCVLLDAPWHQRHEDLVGNLADLRSPASVDVLFRSATARHEYLAYDDAFALGVKCIYALAAIATTHAVECLGALMKSDNAVLEEAARKRLETLSTDTRARGEVRSAAYAAIRRTPYRE